MLSVVNWRFASTPWVLFNFHPSDVAICWYFLTANSFLEKCVPVIPYAHWVRGHASYLILYFGIRTLPTDYEKVNSVSSRDGSLEMISLSERSLSDKNLFIDNHCHANTKCVSDLIGHHRTSGQVLAGTLSYVPKQPRKLCDAPLTNEPSNWAWIMNGTIGRQRPTDAHQPTFLTIWISFHWGFTALQVWDDHGSEPPSTLPPCIFNVGPNQGEWHRADACTNCGRQLPLPQVTPRFPAASCSILHIGYDHKVASKVARVP